MPIGDGRGGARPGSGRKSHRDENKIRDAIEQAVAEVFPGGITEGFKKLLQHPDAGLQKFAWSHVIGNPVDRKYIELSGQNGGPIQTLDLSKYSPEQLRDMLAILDDPKSDDPNDDAQTSL